VLAADTILQNRYRILRLLGQGGMGAVYLAEDRRFGSHLALKEALFDQLRLRKAFEREAKLLHRLRHPALPVVMDYFTEGQGQYLVMQFIPGRDLEQFLEERRMRDLGLLPVDRVLRWADQLLDALEYLHGNETPIIHRDIKPANLKLTPHDEVVLLDFGLAKSAATESSQSPSLHGYSLHYAPLEQVEGRGTDPRSDLYSLAATLHHLLTGEIPPTAVTRAVAMLDGRPDPLRPANGLNPRVPQEVARILLLALHQQPDQRPPSARAMREALAAALREEPAMSHPARKSLSHSIRRQKISGAGAETLIVGADAEDDAPPLAPSTRLDEKSTWRKMIARALRLKPRPRAALTAGFVSVALALAGAIFGYQALSRKSDQSQPPTAVTGFDTAPSPTTSPGPSPIVEMMKFYVETESPTRGLVPVAGSQPLTVERFIRFRFTPRQAGFLYIIARDSDDVPAIFLTAQPNPDWGVKTNRIAAGASYNFPPLDKSRIELHGDSTIETYIFIFSAEPLAYPGFLSGRAGHRLSESEQRELSRLREQIEPGVKTEARDDHFVVAAPSEQLTTSPFLFELRLKRR
jgi:serine/threonine protein kinase